MGLVKTSGNMYPFVDYTWNPIKGKCKMGCSYCYVPHTRAKRFYEGEPYLSEKELKTNLGDGNFIFVGSMNDIWGDWIPSEWITKILKHCQKYNNKYLFQSKNPERFLEFKNGYMPSFCVWGTTCECDSIKSILRIGDLKELNATTMISIEPIMKIKSIKSLVSWIKILNPSFVVIGADSKGHNLSEPSSKEIKSLINQLSWFTKVISKDNLKRLL